MVFMILLIVFSVLIFTFPDFFSKGLDYMTEENEPYIYIGLFILVFVISFIKKTFFMGDSQFIDMGFHGYFRPVTEPSEKKLRELLWLSKSSMTYEPISDKNSQEAVKRALALSEKLQSYCSLNVIFDFSIKKLKHKDFVSLYRRMDFVAPDKFHVTQDAWDAELGEVGDTWISIGDENFQCTGLWMPTYDRYNAEGNEALKIDKYLEILRHNKPINQEVHTKDEERYLILEYQIPLHGKVDDTFPEFPENLASQIYLWINLDSGLFVRGELVIKEKNNIVGKYIDVYACHNENIKIETPVLNTTEADEKGEVTIINTDIVTVPHYLGKYADVCTYDNENMKAKTPIDNATVLNANDEFTITNTDIKKTSTLQRWLQIILGVLLLPICLVFIFISIVFIIDSLDTATSIVQVLLTIVFGSIILLGSLWFTNVTIRHILNKPRTKTLDEQLPPWVLYFMSMYFIVIPIISMVTGAFFEDLVRNLILLPFFIIAGINAYQYAKFKASEKNKKRK